MGRIIAHRELRNSSSAILREVQAGETFTITNHGEPVAVLGPVGSGNPVSPRVRPARIHGEFSSLVGVIPGRPTQEILDELRGDR